MTKAHSGAHRSRIGELRVNALERLKREKRKVKIIQRCCATVLGVIFFLVLLSCALPEESTGHFSF